MPIVVPTSTTSNRTFGLLTDEVLSSLSGYVRDQEISTSLAAPIGAEELTFTVTNSDNASGGIVEIGEELFWVDRVDRTTGVITVAPWGRGFQNTPATTHDVYERVTFNPRYPRWRVKRAINDALYSIGTMVPATETVTFDIQGAVTTYELPAGSDLVLNVRYQTFGPSGEWIEVRSFNFDANANTTQYPSGCTISLSVPAGHTVQVEVQKDPSQLAEEDDLFTSTGLPLSCFDVAVFGSCYRLVAYSDTGRIDYKSVEADALDEPNPFSSSVGLSKYFFQLYSQRLDEEAKRFQNVHKVRIRYTR